MEYTQIEQDVLDLMKRADFKNLSKSEVISFASKLGDLRPEVAKELLSMYPELVELMKTTLSEYRLMLNDIISSDDASIKEYYGIANKEMDIAADSRTQFYDMVKLVQADCSKLLENPSLPPETIMEILNREAELVKIANEKDSEIREQEIRIEDNAYNKDSEKRDFNWKVIGGISFTVIAIAAVSASVLGGNFDFKLPQK